MGGVGSKATAVGPYIRCRFLFFFLFLSSDGWGKTKLKLRRFHVSDTCGVSI